MRQVEEHVNDGVWAICRACAAVVANPEIHDEWHRLLQQPPAPEESS